MLQKLPHSVFLDMEHGVPSRAFSLLDMPPHLESHWRNPKLCLSGRGNGIPGPCTLADPGGARDAPPVPIFF